MALLLDRVDSQHGTTIAANFAVRYYVKEGGGTVGAHPWQAPSDGATVEMWMANEADARTEAWWRLGCLSGDTQELWVVGIKEVWGASERSTRSWYWPIRAPLPEYCVEQGSISLIDENGEELQYLPESTDAEAHYFYVKMESPNYLANGQTVTDSIEGRLLGYDPEGNILDSLTIDLVYGNYSSWYHRLTLPITFGIDVTTQEEQSMFGIQLFKLTANGRLKIIQTTVLLFLRRKNMKKLFSMFLVFLVPFVFFSGSAKQRSKYPVFTSQEFHSHLEDKDLISPKAFLPKNAELREPLLLKKNYAENSEAHEELLAIYQKLHWAWRNNTSKNWYHPDNIKMLTSFIKKYPDTRHAVTAKLLLGEVVGTPFHTNYGGIYWALDLWREIYEQFPGKWQGKVSLYYIYEKIYYPSVGTEAEWAYQYLDDFERSAFELEELHFAQDKPLDYAEYEDLRRVPLLWHQVWMGYCYLSLYKSLEAKNLRSQLLNDSKRIACHELEVCIETKWCPNEGGTIETYLMHMSLHSSKPGLCAVPSPHPDALFFDWKAFCSKPFTPPPREPFPW